VRVVDRYPGFAVAGSCFMSRCMLEPGERVLDTDVDVENLPGYGRLVISERMVRDMVPLFGWTLMTPALERNHAELVAELDDTRAQLHDLMEAMAGIVNLPTVERALSIAARQVAGKATVQEWIDSLPAKASR